MANEDIFAAISEGAINSVREILEQDPSLAKQSNESAISPLMMAMYHRNTEITKLIREHVGKTDLFEAAALGETKRLKELLQDPEMTGTLSADGFTALHFAAFFAHADAAALLLETGADVNAIADNPSRVQPLHSAVAGADFLIVQMLIDAGADVNACQNQGFTPLMGAAANGHMEILDVLVRSGADLGLQSDDGKTALHFAREKDQAVAIVFLERSSL